eukprot:Gregarina_sp_Poly_1__381@NODE_1095_length_5109_cov_377_047997_g759_i0_p1_GENE_NODE_1095_length_5109_cov_377_047997_g759_i0NODE_1095_length_5109_cov_377_047997_g759_i0_p1_ORF_typecomplete_len840_score81_87Ribonuc_red_lgC/PF02867_15/2_7e190Ribonuc_red_lgN/PF00317_21/6_5e03Ribonuc_red_lgN/PF00317_21/9e31ATPcone/PF03477_16/1_2e15ATPcone/PF03477_16/1e04Ly6_related/PF06579_12/0_087_NODE_1095_length_5109_cov_377_047997_g759_i024534972
MKIMSNPSESAMYVINRHGEAEDVSFDKILTRIASLAKGLHPLVNPTKVAQAVINGMFSGISTSELDNLAAQTCAYMAATHPDFSKLAARISVSNLHKNTKDDFVAVIEDLYLYHDNQGRNASLIAKDVYDFVIANSEELNKIISYDRDFEFDYFAFKTLERSYLLRMKGKIVERPQHLFLRVSCGIHCGDLNKVRETYELMSQKYFTHATPTLFNSGTPHPQMSSCFLLQMTEDSICGIFDTLKSCALISKSAGGIGLAIHKIRASGTYISGTNGRSNGIIPMLRVYNDTARYVDQGGGKRKGSFAIYLEPWHADIFEFLDMRKNHGKEEARARDLFYALWVCDLFMQRVEADAEWTLMCPHLCPGLPETHGDEFNDLYQKYEKEGRGVRTVKAQQLWFAILQSQIETGNPFMVYKDSCNRKSNQKNLGTIQCSNLCTEIVEYTAPDEIAVCNLASVALSRFVDLKTKTFDFHGLYRVTKIITANLNKVIDRNHYPVEEARKSNLRHRPIGIGVQGFADALMLLRLPYEDPHVVKLNAEIFETIYFAACEASCDLAESQGPYETFHGSPASKGILQFDMWNDERGRKSLPPIQLSGRWNWTDLKERIVKHGMRNSLLVAPMPTASTSQILGNCESFEPYTSNIYTRRVLSGEFFVVNPHLLKDLIDMGLWNDTMKQRLIAANGSVQNIFEIPEQLRQIYKTVWEIKQRALVDLAAGRAPFIDQSQSLNVYVTNPTFAKLSSMHFYGWKSGLKTGMYYLRTQAAVDAIKFTVDKATVTATKALKQGLMMEAITTAESAKIVQDDKENVSVSSAPVKVCPFRRKSLTGVDPREICEACSG